jgi:hypothetical protein
VEAALVAIVSMSDVTCQRSAFVRLDLFQKSWRRYRRGIAISTGQCHGAETFLPKRL